MSPKYLTLKLVDLRALAISLLPFMETPKTLQPQTNKQTNVPKEEENSFEDTSFAYYQETKSIGGSTKDNAIAEYRKVAVAVIKTGNRATFGPDPESRSILSACLVSFFLFLSIFFRVSICIILSYFWVYSIRISGSVWLYV